MAMRRGRWGYLWIPRSAPTLLARQPTYPRDPTRAGGSDPQLVMTQNIITMVKIMLNFVRNTDLNLHIHNNIV